MQPSPIPTALLLLALGPGTLLGAPGSATAQEADQEAQRESQQEAAATVLSVEDAVARGREFLDLLRQGDAEAMYARLDPFSRLRWTEEQFRDDVRRLRDQYGGVKDIRLEESRDGRPFFHAYFTVTHEKSVVLYHLALTISGAVMRFEVDAVDGQRLEAPTP